MRKNKFIKLFAKRYQGYTVLRDRENSLGKKTVRKIGEKQRS